MEIPRLVNPEVVGKIIEFAQNREVFLRKVLSLQPASVHAYSLIAEWSSVTAQKLPVEDWDFHKMLFDNLKRKCEEIDVICRNHLLTIIKVIASVVPAKISCFHLIGEEEELKADVFEMLVSGCLLKASEEHLDGVAEYIENAKIIDAIFASDNEKFRTSVLRSLQRILMVLPKENHMISRLQERMLDKRTPPFRNLEILTFLLQQVMPEAKDDEHVDDCLPYNWESCMWCWISEGLDSQDLTARKQAFHVTKEAIKNLYPESEEHFIAILNAVEQNQTHLIVPALKMLPKIAKLNINWQKLLLMEIMKNHNKQIVIATLEHLMAMHELLGNYKIAYLLDSVFHALNQNIVYQEDTEVVQSFCLLAFRTSLEALERMSLVSWKPFPLFSILSYLTGEETETKDISQVNAIESLQRIIECIFNLQIDQLMKREIVFLLIKLVKRVISDEVTDSPEDDQAMVVRKITEVTNDEEIIKRCSEILNDSSILPQNLLESFKSNPLEMFNNAQSFADRDLLHLAKQLSTDVEIDEEKATELLLRFKHHAHKQRFVLLLILKAKPSLYTKNGDLCKIFIDDYFTRDAAALSSGRDFQLTFEKLFIEVVSEILNWFRSHINDSPGNSREILTKISCAFESGQEYCTTVSLFKILDMMKMSDEEKDEMKRLLEVAYKEMMAYKGKSPFASHCSAFILAFPTVNLSLEETMWRLLDDITLNSLEICRAIAGKVDQISESLLVKLLASRETVQESFLMRNSPLRDLQLEIIDYAIQSGRDALLLDKLVTKYGELSRSKAMYYPNSNHHLYKLRIIQAIAAIVRVKKIWHPQFLVFLLNESNQPSILYILELIVACAIPTEDIDRLIAMLKAPQDLKMHSAQSIFCILYLYCRRIKFSAVSRQCFTAIYPWTMGQNFSCRLYAQIAVLKICELMRDVEPHEKIICETIKFSFSHLSGNPEKSIARLEQDFRFNRLNIDDLLSLTYIFRDIPRITGVAESEIVANCSGEEDLKDVIHPWHEKQSSGGVAVQQTYDNIQTKILPPKEATEVRKTELIVCASLVENHPNLGGLARTCEIFGVQKMIIDSLRDVEHKDFLALSMSAEKWLTLEEVKKWQLNVFLSQMKMQGYTIVGAEQTSRSVKLAEVKFPEKSLLILGHEKEGLPADIIASLDIVVEIQQIGHLASLNVHVTGSILINEYLKQHI
ncbi:uncharacterized protein LOC132265900 [Phlebotomus argentipes]|uniref:uncharacterized protein LOC132265900 n=1 Tax=Phlebotomus argentipes TaxID=94469 RepID=UPI002892E977|nr:uncharacterized protein LOC132265900 [Phlebotomus argentipes]